MALKSPAAHRCADLRGRTLRDLDFPNSRIPRAFCLSLLFSFFVFTPNANAETRHLIINPPTINFGSVNVGASKTQPVTMTYMGWRKLTIIGIAEYGTDFAVGGLTYPLTLTHGRSVTGTVTFTPHATGTRQGRLIITKRIGDQKWSTTRTVTLIGNGIGSGAGQLVATPSTVSFGNVQVGGSQTAVETLRNSGGTTVTISNVSATGSGFSTSGLTSPFTLAAGQSANLKVTFSPGAAGSTSGNLAITSNAADPVLNVALSGTGSTPGQLAAKPASVSFGSVATGSNNTLAETLSNMGTSALTISQLVPSGGFSYSGINPPLTLGAGQSVTFSIIFAPKTGGTFSGSLVATSNGSNQTLTVPLSGSAAGPGQLTISPSTVNFGNVMDGTTQTQSASLTASNGPVTVSSVTVSPSEFSLGGMALPVTIPTGYTLTFSAVFKPTSMGAVSGTLSFASNASNTPKLTVSGVGTTPPQHSVALRWSASTSSNVMGYNIYRGTVSGGPYTQVNSGLDTTTTDTDSTVQGGQTYYYVVTAIDSAGVESAYSNQTTAIIPYP